jgi:hypothetical protein
VDVDQRHDRQFPEWHRLPRAAVWEYTGTRSRQLFKCLYGRKHLFQDLQLAMEPGTDEGILRLKENGEWLEIPVSAHWNRTTDHRAERWDRSVKGYTKTLARRERTFNQNVARAVTRYRKRFAQRHKIAWASAKPKMNKNEHAMELDQWQNYSRERPMETEATAGISPWTSFATSIKTSGFGSCNIDRILVMPEQMNVMASTIDEKGQPFPWVRAYAVPRGKRAVVTYQGIGEGTNDLLLVAPGLMHDMVLVDASGNVAIADARALNDREPRVTLHVERLNNVTRIEDLHALVQR